MEKQEREEAPAPRNKVTEGQRADVERRFGPYRRPTEVTIPKFEAIQKKCQELALLIHDICPFSQQKATALTQLEMCKMSANAAIAIHTPETTTPQGGSSC